MKYLSEMSPAGRWRTEQNSAKVQEWTEHTFCVNFLNCYDISLAHHRAHLSMLGFWIHPRTFFRFWISSFNTRKFSLSHSLLDFRHDACTASNKQNSSRKSSVLVTATRRFGFFFSLFALSPLSDIFGSVALPCFAMPLHKKFNNAWCSQSYFDSRREHRSLAVCVKIKYIYRKNNIFLASPCRKTAAVLYLNYWSNENRREKLLIDTNRSWHL